MERLGCRERKRCMVRAGSELRDRVTRYNEGYGSVDFQAAFFHTNEGQEYKSDGRFTRIQRGDAS